MMAPRNLLEESAARLFRLLRRLVGPLAEEEDGDGGLLSELLLTFDSPGQGGGGSKRRLDRFVQAAWAIFAEDQVVMNTLWQQAAEPVKEEDEVKSEKKVAVLFLHNLFEVIFKNMVNIQFLIL
jgi:hypothetical protein